MKRSQMLGKLYDYLYKETDLNEESLEKICNDVLDLVEENGMEPPPSLKEVEGNPLVPGDIKHNGKWCTPGHWGWEDS